MSKVEIVGNIVCFAGAALWIYGYFVTGHPAVLDWPSFTPWWISSFLPNVEAEIGLVASFAGMGLTWLPISRQ